jgi:trimeric autotransporter adhesin
MTPKKQVSPAIRILRGERDASARATHLEAATRKFLVTTNERKQMSTTTNFKRIALVAVAALGMGVLSSVPSQAAFSGAAGSQLTLSTTAAAGTLAGAASDSTTAGTVSIAGLALGAASIDSYSVTAVAKSRPAAATSQPTLNFLVVDTVGTTGGDPTLTGSTSVLAIATAAPTQLLADSRTTMVALSAGAGYLNVKYKFFQDSNSAQRKAGTYVYTVIVTPFSGAAGQGIAQTIDVSVVTAAAASASETVDPTKSTAGMALGATTGATTDAIITADATASPTAVGTLSVRTYNSSSVAVAESVTVSISGAGILKSGDVAGTSLVLNSSGSADISILPDGRAGIATISVKTTTVTFANKTVTFYAKAAKTITATVATPLLKVGTNAGAVRSAAVDANGNLWAGTSYIVASSAADALIAGSTTPVECLPYVATDGYAKCPLTAIATGTAKFKIIDASTVALATATSNEVTVTVTAATLASVKIEFDKATYAPNERAMIYVTPLDAAGKAMQSATYTNLFTTGATGGISVNGALSYSGSTTTADSLTAAHGFTTAEQNSSTSRSRAGSMQFTVYMPAAGGTVTLTATGGTALAESLRKTGGITASATVTDSGAAALAAVTALATTVASLKTLITTLTNLVLKIQKKVKA